MEHKPKEHGAYAILAIPIITALVTAGPSLVGLCVAVASAAGFLAHEPLLVMIGHRGGRAQRESRSTGRYFASLVAVLSVTGSVAMLAGDNLVRLSLLGCFFLAALSFGIAVAGKHRTLIGQMGGVVGLSAPCIPILLAGGVDANVAGKTWLIWLLGFAATTLAVRGVIAFQRKKFRTVHFSGLAMISALTALIVLRQFADFSAAFWILPVIPMVAASWYLMISPPPAKRLKQVGWSLVAATVVTAISVVLIP